LPVRAANIRRRTLDLELPQRQTTSAALGPGVLTGDPISVPFEGAGFAAHDEPFAVLSLGTAQGVLGVAHGTARRVPFPLYTGKFCLRHVVLPFP
jgi:hypothetical protein